MNSSKRMIQADENFALVEQAIEERDACSILLNMKEALATTTLPLGSASGNQEARQSYHAIRFCDSLLQPAIFWAWEDCAFYVNDEHDDTCITQKGVEICNSRLQYKHCSSLSQAHAFVQQPCDATKNDDKAPGMPKHDTQDTSKRQALAPLESRVIGESRGVFENEGKTSNRDNGCGNEDRHDKDIVREPQHPTATSITTSSTSESEVPPPQHDRMMKETRMIIESDKKVSKPSNTNSDEESRDTLDKMSERKTDENLGPRSYDNKKTRTAPSKTKLHVHIRPKPKWYQQQLFPKKRFGAGHIPPEDQVDTKYHIDEHPRWEYDSNGDGESCAAKDSSEEEPRSEEDSDSDDAGDEEYVPSGEDEYRADDDNLPMSCKIVDDDLNGLRDNHGRVITTKKKSALRINLAALLPPDEDALYERKKNAAPVPPLPAGGYGRYQEQPVAGNQNVSPSDLLDDTRCEVCETIPPGGERQNHNFIDGDEDFDKLFNTILAGCDPADGLHSERATSTTAASDVPAVITIAGKTQEESVHHNEDHRMKPSRPVEPFAKAKDNRRQIPKAASEADSHGSARATTSQQFQCAHAIQQGCASMCASGVTRAVPVTPPATKKQSAGAGEHRSSLGESLPPPLPNTHGIPSSPMHRSQNTIRTSHPSLMVYLPSFPGDDTESDKNAKVKPHSDALHNASCAAAQEARNHKKAQTVPKSGTLGRSAHGESATPTRDRTSLVAEVIAKARAKARPSQLTKTSGTNSLTNEEPAELATGKPDLTVGDALGTASKFRSRLDLVTAGDQYSSSEATQQAADCVGQQSPTEKQPVIIDLLHSDEEGETIDDSSMVRLLPRTTPKDEAPREDNEDQETPEEMERRLTIQNLQAKKEFPIVLHNLIDYSIQNGKQHTISWTEDGLSFQVCKPRRLAVHILPEFFGDHFKYPSFENQLQLWGFTVQRFEVQRMGVDCHTHSSTKIICSHRHFCRDRKDWCSRIKKKGCALPKRVLPKKRKADVASPFGTV